MKLTKKVLNLMQVLVVRLIRRLAGLLFISDVNSGNARKRALDRIQN